jgi:hypothetical protein
MPDSSPFMNGAQTPLDNINIGNIEEIAMQIVQFFCSVVSLPLEFALRPFYGSQYVPAPVLFLACLMMLFLPLVFALAGSVSHLLPFMPASAPPPGISLGDLSRYFSSARFFTASAPRGAC